MRHIASDGLQLEIRAREMVGPLVPARRWGLGWIWLFYGLAALPLLALAVCIIVTAAYAVQYLVRELPGIEHPHWPGTLFLLGGTAVWLLCATLIWALGFGLAYATRGARHLSTPIVLILVLPFATSVLVAGVGWRAVVDPVHGLVPNPYLLGTDWVWVVLVTAFAWSWLGFAVSLFRAGMDAIDHDPAAREAFQRERWWRRPARPELRPVTWALLLTLWVAATRVFELVLIMVPSAQRVEIGAPALHWWRMDVTSGSDKGPAAVVAIGLLLTAGLFALGIFLFTRPDRPRWIPPAPSSSVFEHARRPRRQAIVVGWGAAAVVLLPIGLLLYRSFTRNPTNTDTGGGITTASWGQVLGPGLDAGLGSSMLVSGVVATAATTTTVLAAIGLAYLLASNVHRFARGALTALLVLLAIAPVQAYIVPFRQVVDQLDMGGTKIPLILLHVAVFLPYATLVLRSALGLPEHRGSTDMLFGLTGSTVTVGRLAERIGPALIAVFVLQWVLVYNDFLIGFLLVGPGSSPVTVLLWGEARQFSVSIGPVAAGSLLASVPPVLLVLATWRRWVVPGLTRGLLR